MAAWRLSGWERLYGRLPTEDDVVVPTRTMTPRETADAGHALSDDLGTLGMRHRRGHDLRRTFISLALEDGARLDLLDTVSHGPRGDIISVYSTFPWPALCAEIAKLRIELLDGRVLDLPTVLPTNEVRARKRWKNVATPAGFEPASPT